MDILIKMLGKRKVWALARKVLWKLLGKLGDEVKVLVRAAEFKSDLTDGWAKARWVATQYVKQYDEPKEWGGLGRWVIQVAIELAVGEMKGYADDLINSRFILYLLIKSRPSLRGGLCLYC